jgi:hypothetical protein
MGMLAGSGASRPVIIFVHLPKAAGSTLARIIERQYSREAVLHLRDSIHGEEILALPPAGIENLKAVFGHFYFGVHTYLSRPATYLTLLRDPVRRVISHYRFVRNDPGHYLYPAARELSLGEYVTDCGQAEPNNDQTRLLAGSEYAREDGTWSAEMLPAAKMNLRGHFSAVGLVEEFDRSLILMKRVFGWRHPFYVPENVSRQQMDKDLLSAETMNLIRDYNQLDVQLYDYGKQIFETQVRREGASLERELGFFRKVNSLYGKLTALKAAVPVAR